MATFEWGVAVFAQFVGVTITLAAYFGLHRTTESGMRLGIIVPFIFTYALFSLAFATLGFGAASLIPILAFIWGVFGEGVQETNWQDKLT